MILVKCSSVFQQMDILGENTPSCILVIMSYHKRMKGNFLVGTKFICFDRIGSDKFEHSGIKFLETIIYDSQASAYDNVEIVLLLLVFVFLFISGPFGRLNPT